MRGILIILLIALTGTAHASTRGISIVAKDSITGQEGEVQLYRKSFAIIVGIDRYQNLPPDKQLKNAVRDAQGIEEVLRRNYRFDEIVMLTDEQATKERIMRLLTSELPERMTENDALFLFWAGHGNQQKSALGEIGYLIPFDGAVDAVYKNITMAEIRDTISKILPAKHAFYVMDACYSGLLTTTRSLDSKPKRELAYLQEITKESVRQVLTAGGKGEEALDGGPKGHSVFTGRLIEVLEAAGDFITANEIQAILREKVFQDARARNHTQTPGFGVLYGTGDFVFVPNTEQKVAEVAAEVAKLEAEMAALLKKEDAALKAQDEAGRRAAARERQLAEAKLRAEKLRQEQLTEESRRQDEQLKEQQRLAAELKQQQDELLAKRREEEQRLAQLKAEIEKKRQNAPRASTSTIQSAVAEIKRLATEINTIEGEFKVEQQAAEKRISDRYTALLNELKAQENKKLVQDMFETDFEFERRKKRSAIPYMERRKKLEAEQQAELSELRRRIEKESVTQTTILRKELLALSKKEFTLGSDSVAFEVGRYDVGKGFFPFTLNTRQGTDGTELIKVAMNGSIPMPRDMAKEWYGHLQNGLVRPQVTVKPDGQILKIALANDVDKNMLLTLENGQFITLREKERVRALIGEMVLIKGGCFQMGDTFREGEPDEKPAHEICLDDFYLGKYEVTQVQWEQLMGRNPSHFSTCSNCPVENVSWEDVQDFIIRLNKRTGLARLPTEAEWEYACRSGGQKEKYCGGNNVDAFAWYEENSDKMTHPVGEKTANALGLHDMTGNVAEWVQDWYDPNYYSQSPKNNPPGPTSGDSRVFRGGSWSGSKGFVRAADRIGIAPDYSNFFLGLRLAFPAN